MFRVALTHVETIAHRKRAFPLVWLNGSSFLVALDLNAKTLGNVPEVSHSELFQKHTSDFGHACVLKVIGRSSTKKRLHDVRVATPLCVYAGARYWRRERITRKPLSMVLFQKSLVVVAVRISFRVVSSPAADL